MLAICGTDAQILDDRLPEFLKFLDAGVLSLWVLSVQRASHRTPATFNFEVTPELLFTAGVSASDCISNAPVRPIHT